MKAETTRAVTVDVAADEAASVVDVAADAASAAGVALVLVKCTRQFVQTAARNVKFLLSPSLTDLYTAGTALETTGLLDK